MPASRSIVAIVEDDQSYRHSGLELFDRLTASAQPRPAIFITAQDEDSVRQRASRIPKSVYLRKPVVGTVLLEAIRSLLSHSSSGAESPGT